MPVNVETDRHAELRNIGIGNVPSSNSIDIGYVGPGLHNNLKNCAHTRIENREVKLTVVVVSTGLSDVDRASSARTRLVVHDPGGSGTTVVVADAADVPGV